MARSVNGFCGTFTTLAGVTAQYPPSEHAGCSANIGTQAPYLKAWCDGVSWGGLTSAQVAALQASAAVNVITFAALNALTLADYAGVTFFVMDVGLHGSLWRCDGATLGIVGGSAVVALDHVAAAPVTGTSETVTYTYSIPAGLLGPNGAIEIQGKYTMTNNANTKTVRARLGGIGGASLTAPQISSFATGHFTFRIENRNSVSSQIGSNGTFNLTASVGAWSTSAVNTAVAQDLVVTFQLGVGTDSINRESIRVILYRP